MLLSLCNRVFVQTWEMVNRSNIFERQIVIIYRTVNIYKSFFPILLHQQNIYTFDFYDAWIDTLLLLSSQIYVADRLLLSDAAT